MGRERVLTDIPLKFGPMAIDGCIVMHSGVRWLCEDGHVCRPGEIVAYCNVGLARAGDLLFAEEFRDLQAAFAPRVGGRLRISPSGSRGGFMDQLHYSYRWRPDFVPGYIEADPGLGSLADGPQDELRLIVMAGRRTSELAEVRSGLLTGWHDRSRAWSAEADGRQGCLLSVGICEQAGIIRGERGAFLELLEAAEGPAQAVYSLGEPLVQCSRVLLEQLRRTPEDARAIAEDAVHSLSAGANAPLPDDWIFMGALMSGLCQRPIGETYEVFTRTQIFRSAPADALLLSIKSEANVVLRHKRLGYAVRCHQFRFHDVSPCLHAWLQTSFEPVRRTYDDILRDYVELIDVARASSPDGQGPAILMMNAMSTEGLEDIQTYTAFDRPMGDTLGSVYAKELNLLVHDLAALRDISIVDSDAIAADLGGWAHILDGVHQSGPMQAEIREEILHILASRRRAGPPPSS